VDENTVTFMLVDAKGAGIKVEFLTYVSRSIHTGDWSARARCMVDYDEGEILRVSLHSWANSYPGRELASTAFLLLLLQFWYR